MAPGTPYTSPSIVALSSVPGIYCCKNASFVSGIR